MTAPPTRVLERPGGPPPSGAPRACRRRGRGPERDRFGVCRDRILAVIRRDWVAVTFGGSAVFAAVTALISFNAPERVWGDFAAVSYALAAVAAAAVRRRGVGLAVLISLAGALAAPLAWMASTGLAQPEVGVVIRSAQMLVHQGTPYAGPAALAAAHSWHAYDPYLPALIVFGVPRVLAAGPLTDPRIWFGVAFVAAFAVAARVAGAPRPGWATALVAASPVVALPLAVGGDDLPVLGLMCLGLALAARAVGGSWQWAAVAGVALGLAAAMKATAWPAPAVVFVLLAARGGRRAAAWFGVAAVGVAVAADGPVIAAHPAAAVTNTVLYPLGLTKVASPAASLLPGHVLAGAGAWGHRAALVLMLAAGAGVGISLLVRAPRDAHGAGWRLALGMTLVFLLAPASRVGYFVYPLGLAAWLLLSRPPLLGGLSVDPVPAYQGGAVSRGD